MKRLGPEVSQIITKHEGVQLLMRGHENAFGVKFVDAERAVACALELQQPPLDPFRLRIGIHSAMLKPLDAVQIIDTAAQLCDLAQGNQVIMSGAVADRVLGRLPEGAWLMGMGLRSRDQESSLLVQLCHPTLCNAFPSLRASDATSKRLSLSIAK